MWATFQIFLAAFSYLADWYDFFHPLCLVPDVTPWRSYGPYASSAIAGQNLFRNILGTIFPLFTTQFFNAVTYKWGNTIFGYVAVLMAPIPFVRFCVFLSALA